MLGTCAPYLPHLLSMDKHQDLVPGNKGERFWTEGFGKGCLVGACEGLSLISCPATDFLGDLGLPVSLISRYMN